MHIYFNVYNIIQLVKITLQSSMITINFRSDLVLATTRFIHFSCELHPVALSITANVHFRSFTLVLAILCQILHF